MRRGLRRTMVERHIEGSLRFFRFPRLACVCAAIVMTAEFSVVLQAHAATEVTTRSTTSMTMSAAASAMPTTSQPIDYQAQTQPASSQSVGSQAQTQPVGNSFNGKLSNSDLFNGELHEDGSFNGHPRLLYGCNFIPAKWNRTTS